MSCPTPHPPLGFSRGQADLHLTLGGTPVPAPDSGKTLRATSGLLLLTMDAGRWSVSYVALDGTWAKKDGSPGARKGTIYFTSPLEPGGAPAWLRERLATHLEAFNAAMSA